jgi:hypothetical protein
MFCHVAVSAINIAEAGTDYALWEMNYNGGNYSSGDGWTGTDPKILTQTLQTSAGVSVGAYTIYSLKSNNVAPIAMACQKVDLTVASGCALANIPLFILSPDEYDSIKDGDEISLG